MQDNNKIVDDHDGKTSTTFQLTRFTGSGPLSKQIKLVDGKIEKTLAPPLYRGRFEVLAVNELSELIPILTALDTNQALSFGVPRSSLMTGRVVTDGTPEANRPRDAITRTREAFRWPDGGGILHLDYDAPDEGEALTRDALLAELYAVLPGLRHAPHIYWPSSSSYLYDGETEVCGTRGQHVYVGVRDASDIERAGEALNKRLWLRGLGRIKINSAGAKLKRSLIDGLVFQPERLCFSAGAICLGTLSQRRGDPQLLGGAVPLDTVEHVMTLTSEEERRYAKLETEAMRAAEPKAAPLREANIKAKGGTLARGRGIDVAVAEATVRAAVENQRLQADFVLVGEDGRTASVQEILRNRDAWHNTRIRHPLDDDYPDHRIGVLNLKPTYGHPYAFVHSGPIKFTLHATLKRVRVEAGAIMKSVDDTLDAVIENGRVFVRGPELVAVGADARVAVLTHHAWKNELDSTVAFERFAESKVDKTTQVKGTHVPTNVEDDLALRVKAKALMGSLPRLLAVVDHPIVLPSGRVLVEPGFDAESRLYLARRESHPWPQPRECPTLDEVHLALRTLRAPVALFPYATDVARGAMLAALLTAGVRPGLSTAPAFLTAAPAAGTGKSAVAECLAILAGGAPAVVLPATEEERHKTFSSLLLEGAPAMWFDNVEGSLVSPNFCALLTAPAQTGYSGRILGKSQTSGPLPSNTLVLFTGNNLVMRDDLARRVVTIYLDAGVEAPASRQFAFHPPTVCSRQRIELIRAVLTILCAWVATPAFKSSRGRVGSFEEWDRLICGGVNWLDSEGMTTEAGERWGDPKASIDDAIEANSGVGEVEALYRAWAGGGPKHGLMGALGYEMTAKAIFEELERIRAGISVRDAVVGAAARAVHEAGVLFQKPQTLGLWLTGFCNKVAGGYVLRSKMNREKVKLWSLERSGSS